MNRTWGGACLVGGGLAGFAGTVLDALVAHAFSHRVDAHALATLATVARYLQIHGLLLVALGLGPRAGAAFKFAALMAATGIVLFCAGLTASVLAGVAALGAAAPLGGTAFMAAWLACAVGALVERSTPATGAPRE